ncbi:MAG: CHAP domain-containing protein [Chitinophagales bacterium]|nr:CHAP domain-containing protein [Chitinophagales bacterium]
MKYLKSVGLLFFILALSVSGYSQKIGDVIDTYNGVDVYYNGVDYLKSQGRHYAKDGYYYGQKWQCVEFIKRYMYDAHQHKFPNGMGHAYSFISLLYNQGELNKERGMYQYYNDDNVKPKVDDIMVFPYSEYGHVCIVTKVTDNSVEVIQQNIIEGTRATYPLTYKNGRYSVGDNFKRPAGWLRLPKFN